MLAHEPTDTSKAEVKALVSFGTTQEQISMYLDIDIKTLQKHYRRELDTATTQANAQVAKRLFNKAVAQDDLSAQIFWLKTRARWRTKDKEDEANVQGEQLEELKALRRDLTEKNVKDF